MIASLSARRKFFWDNTDSDNCSAHRDSGAGISRSCGNICRPNSTQRWTKKIRLPDSGPPCAGFFIPPSPNETRAQRARRLTAIPRPLSPRSASWSRNLGPALWPAALRPDGARRQRIRRYGRAAQEHRQFQYETVLAGAAKQTSSSPSNCCWV